MTVRRLMLGVCVMVAAFVVGPSVAAAAPHFTHGGSPVCTITTSGGTASVSCPTELAGLGEGDLLIETAQGAFGVQTLLNAPIVALVTSGQLAVTQARGLFGQDRKLTLVAGHRLAVQQGDTLDAGKVRPLVAAERERLLAWRDGMLSFGGESLGDAVRAFDRYGPKRIIVLDPELARQKVTGLFKADDPAGFAAAVAASFGGVITSEREVIRISPK